MVFILRALLESTPIFGRLQSAKHFFPPLNSIHKQQYNLIYVEVSDIRSKWRHAAAQGLEQREMTNKPKNMLKPGI